MEKFSIMATAAAVPDKVVTNDDLAEIMDTSDEWISSRTGIRQRHITTEQSTTDLATAVAEQLLQKAAIEPAKIDFIIVATMSPDNLAPTVAAQVQSRIQADHAFAFDINVACTGFVSALSLASKLLSSHYQHGIVIGAETLSRLVDWEERSTAVLFGDGAGGVLMSESDEQIGLLSESLHSYGEQGSALTAGQISAQTRWNPAGEQTDLPFKMDGRAVYQFATRRVPQVINEAIDAAGVSLDDVDYFVLHQANARIVKSIANHLDQPITKFPMDVASYGNTSAASIPILLAELVEQGQLHAGQKIMLAGFGAGLSTGATLIQI
ncbi:3-oxoacyl-[acyl-carrier-protein] synthase-3 [Weissella uvarum]|uniref:beta-ketoacyl-ACP synthase III n=1 Tax=Weissella uvarum TaxID=1479233 RepID=UPI00195FE39F|nr:beta-ketoacyl-ACP synthase III [Weissella uvarum]MBM7617731.1 3-oxoacyl-[acyl-carrier-protein] synthase-3 [Weissella uvarum]MCM0595890.1 ketoacyl-ACP synthase III [Weissella uvarum]